MVTLRPLTAADIPRAVKLWQETAARTAEADSPEEFARLLERNPDIGHVAEYQGAFVGLAIVAHDGRRGYFHHIGVVPQYRRHGIARKLAELCFVALRNAGITRVHIQLKDKNALGLRFWKGLGCRERSDTVLISLRLSQTPDAGSES